MPRLGVAVVGAGYWGPNLLRNFQQSPDFRLHWLCDVQEDRARAVLGSYSTVRTTASLADVLADDEVDCVAVATPARSHHDVAMAALEAGKHVLVEKPLAGTFDEGQALVDAAAARGLVLMCDHTFCYTPAVAKIRELVHGGVLGDLHYFDSVRINLGLIQTDVNVVCDLAPHDVSIMDYLIAQEPVSVAAQAAGHGGSPTENIAYLTVRYSGSLLGAVHVNWLAPAKVRRTIVGGSKRMMIYDDMEPSEKLKVYDKGVSISSDPSDEYQFMISYRSGDMHAPRLDTREALAVEADNIVAAMDGREPLVSDGRAGARVVRILEAAQRSIEQGGALIALNGAVPAAAG